MRHSSVGQHLEQSLANGISCMLEQLLVSSGHPRPSVMPGPRKEVALVLSALSAGFEDQGQPQGVSDQLDLPGQLKAVGLALYDIGAGHQE